MSLAEVTDNLAEVRLAPPETFGHYHNLVNLLNALIDEVGEDESHHLIRLMDHVGDLVEEFERQHLPELV